MSDDGNVQQIARFVTPVGLITTLLDKLDPNISSPFDVLFRDKRVKTAYYADPPSSDGYSIMIMNGNTVSTASISDEIVKQNNFILTKGPSFTLVSTEREVFIKCLYTTGDNYDETFTNTDSSSVQIILNHGMMDETQVSGGGWYDSKWSFFSRSFSDTVLCMDFIASLIQVIQQSYSEINNVVSLYRYDTINDQQILLGSAYALVRNANGTVVNFYATMNIDNVPEISDTDPRLIIDITNAQFKHVWSSVQRLTVDLQLCFIKL